MSLVSHSFEHICLREGGKSVRSLGKAGLIRIRDEVGVGPWLQAPGQYWEYREAASILPQERKRLLDKLGRGQGKLAWQWG